MSIEAQVIVFVAFLVIVAGVFCLGVVIGMLHEWDGRPPQVRKNLGDEK